ncbi:MAG TPA: transposase [Phycisphaerales bacterium]|nr:transposase [Phycisphaerales bacterium]
MYNEPLAYFITFRTYGTWLHGDERGSVHESRNKFGTPFIEPDAEWLKYDEKHLKHDPVALSDAQRACVDAALRGVCEHHQWILHALNVRTNHVHCVVKANREKDFVMNSLKAWGTRRLNEAGLNQRGTKVWSRHGSTQYIFTYEKLREKIDYVLNQQ